MAASGFFLGCEGPKLATDRFLLVFGKTKPQDLAPGADPLVGGPGIRCAPGLWLKDNGWRLRGLKTADGKLVRLAKPSEREPVKAAHADGGDTEAWKLPNEGLLVMFKKTGARYMLTESRSLGSRQ